MKTKVLYVETGMGFGGAAISLIELVSHLKEHEPVIVFFSSKHEEFTRIFDDYNTYFLDAKFTYIHKAVFYKKLGKRISNSFIKRLISKAYTLSSILHDYYLHLKLSRIIKSENISVIHINNCVHPVPLKAAKKHKIPAIVHLRGHVDCAGSRKSSANTQFQTLIATTNKIRNYAIQELAVDENTIKVIYDSVNPELYNRASWGEEIRRNYNISDQTIVVGMFARIITMKGQLELAKAVHRLLSDNLDITCIFIGDASDFDDDYLNSLKNYIKGTGFSDRFIFTGYKENVPDYYNAIDIAIHGSIEEEAFGRVIIESWASKKPVIATDIAASRELIEDGETGIIVPVGDIDKLSSSILRLAKHPGERNRIASNGHKLVNEVFNSDVIARQVETIYSELR